MNPDQATMTPDSAMDIVSRGGDSFDRALAYLAVDGFLHRPEDEATTVALVKEKIDGPSVHCPESRTRSTPQTEWF